MRKLKRLTSRIILSLVTAIYPVERKGFPVPSEYKIFHDGDIPENVKKSLVRCYIEIFSEAPWYEHWKEEEVLEKIKKDLFQKDSFLVVFLINEAVEGFSWGAIIDKNEIATRAADAIGTTHCTLPFSDRRGKTLYCDEFAISKRGRKGIDVVRFILRVFLEFAYSKGVKETMFWSTPESKIVPLAKTMGYEECGEAYVNQKKIVFLVNKSFVSLLKITRNIRADTVNLIIGFQKRRKNKKAEIY